MSKVKFVLVAIIILGLATFVFPAEVEVGRQLSEWISGISTFDDFTIKSNDETVGRLDVYICLSDADVLPDFWVKVNTWDESDTTQLTSNDFVQIIPGNPATFFSSDNPNPNKEDKVSIFSEGGTSLTRFRMWIRFPSYYNQSDGSLTGFSRLKRIEVRMENLKNNIHLQAYAHGQGLVAGEWTNFRWGEANVAFVKDDALPKPMDVIMVLDVSGSMNGRTIPGEPLSPRKIDVLHVGTEHFLDFWAAPAWKQDDDHVGVVFFRTSDVPFSSSPSGDFLVRFGPTPLDPDVNPDWDSIKNVVTTEPAGGRTAMGEALHHALNNFEPSSNRLRHIILFSNGMQNEGSPQVVYSGAPFTLDGLTLRGYAIPIHTIGVGITDGTTWHNLIQGIADQTGGIANFVISQLAFLIDSSYFQVYVEAMRGMSPSLVGINSGFINKGEGPKTFAYQVDKSAKLGVFVVAWHAFKSIDRNANSINVKLFAPGSIVPFTQGVVHPGNQIHIRSVSFPLAGGQPHEGEWKIEINEAMAEGEPKGQAYYHAGVWVDEAEFSYRAGVLPREDFYGTGETISLRASLSIDGQPITGANVETVECKVTHPGPLSLGAFMHLRDLTDDQLNNNPSGVHEDNFSNRYARKLYRLVVEQNLGHLLEPIEEPAAIKLLDNGNPANGDAVANDGVYNALYKKTKRPGQYTFDFLMKGDHPLVGKFERSEKSTTLVRVKKADLNKSEIIGETLPNGNKLITLVPADKYGNFLGPDYNENITITSSPGDETPVEDERVNGTYTSTLLNAGTNPDVTIRVFDIELFKGKFSDIVFKPKFIVGLYGGRTFPHNSLNIAYDPGLSLEGLAEYLFAPRASVFASVGYNNFNPALVGADKLKIINFSGNLKFYPVIGTFQLSLFAGAGYYLLDPGDNRFGLNAGTAAEVRLTTSFSIEGKYNFHYVFTSPEKTLFSTVQAGLRFRL